MKKIKKEKINQIEKEFKLDAMNNFQIPAICENLRNNRINRKFAIKTQKNNKIPNLSPIEKKVRAKNYGRWYLNPNDFSYNLLARKNSVQNF